MSSSKYVGQSVPREDAIPKVTGTAMFVHDMSLPGMLHAATVKSPHAAARIVSIDTAAARALTGVRAILTGEDLPYRLGLYVQDKLILARDCVRYQGEPVVAIAADTLEIARTACNLVKIEYETEDPVLDPRKAMKSGARLVHPDLHTYS